MIVTWFGTKLLVFALLFAIPLSNADSEEDANGMYGINQKMFAELTYELTGNVITTPSTVAVNRVTTQVRP